MLDVVRNPMLSVRNVTAWYGDVQSLHGITFDVFEGEVVTLLGRNGAGKSTTLKSVMGLVDRRRGQILFKGLDVTYLGPEQIARAGIAFCPEERGIYSSLSVQENLTLPPIIAPGGLGIEEIYQLFPNLWERRASQGTKLSGGEQQMLAIGRILRTGAKLLLLDEPTEGLAPVIVEQIGELIIALKKRGFTIVLVEQNPRFASLLADRHYIVEDGQVVDVVSNDQFSENQERINKYLAV
jgi:branched-chain amino acid transport system ATP-binding protein